MKRAATIFLGALFIVIPVVRYQPLPCGGHGYYLPEGDHYEITCEHGPSYF